MKTLTIARNTVNIEALDEALRSMLGAEYSGLSTRPGEVLVYLEDSAATAQAQQAEQMVIDHDASILSASQQARIDNEAALQQARLDNADALNLSAYDSAAAEVQALAQRIAWLEAEIRDLRGL